MDAAEPPRVVVESPCACSDAARAERELRRMLAPSRAPGHAWTVSMRVDRAGGQLRAEGSIADDDGGAVAHRVIAQRARAAASDCDGLARAIGVWASLVLDAERLRAQAAAAATDADADADEARRAAPESAAKADAGAAPIPRDPWPAPVDPEKPSPEHDWYLHHDDGRTLELGLGAFLESWMGTGSIAGVTPFVVIEAGHGVFLHPAVVVGESPGSMSRAGDARMLLAATRFDACLRLPGLYSTHSGMQLDTCAGADVGFTRFDAALGGDDAGLPAATRTIPRLALGPSLDLRGELGGDLAVAMRGVGGWNVVRESFVDVTGVTVEPPALSGRIEVALSWRLR